jgi:hypothetical protein
VFGRIASNCPLPPIPVFSVPFQIQSLACVSLLSHSPPDIVCCVSRLRHCGGGTDLEDIGDSDGVLGGLALGGDDGDGWPGHGGCCVLTWWLVVAIEGSCRNLVRLRLAKIAWWALGLIETGEWY